MSKFSVKSFNAAARRYHVYRSCWTPQENELLNCFHERNNPFDMFAIQVCQLETNKRVGLLPMEISRISKFLMDRGAIFQARLTSTHYRRSPLVRGGLEIPCEITIRMPSNRCTKELLEKYDSLLNDLYVEPVSKETLGCFLNIQENMENDVEESHNKMIGKKKKPKENIEVQSRDIRSMLKPVPCKDTDESKNTNQIIIID